MRLIKRRAVLGSGLVAGVGTIGAGGRAASTAATLDPTDWDSVRAQFQVPAKLLHFSAYMFAPHPKVVRAAIDRDRAGLDADPIGYLEKMEAGREKAVLRAAQDYLGAKAGEIALTDSTTMGLGLLYGGLRLRRGQEILTTEHDFYPTHEGLRLCAQRTGATVRRVRLYEDPYRAGAAEIVERLRRAVRPETRVVAITWVHSVSGVKLPVRAIADVIAAANKGRADSDRALLCVDGVHGLGVENVTVDGLGCDFLAAGTHKWLFGPRGTGVLWGRREAWRSVAPVIPSFAAGAFAGWVLGTPPVGDPGELGTPGGYHSFEHRWALAQAFRFHLTIGKDRIEARTREQAGRLKDGLGRLPGVRLVTPRDPALSSGIVCCDVLGRPAEVVKRILRERYGIVASVTPYRQRHLRFGPSILTTPEQVDRVIGAMRSLG